MILRILPFAASLACLASCSSLSRVETANPPEICEIHKLPMAQRRMPETDFKGIVDNGAHPEVDLYDKAAETRFPHAGANGPPDGHVHRGGQLFWICPECVKAETAWIHRHPRLTYPEYGTPDPRL